MLLVFHIAVAFSSMAFVTYTYMSPSKAKLFTAWSLAAGTLATGTVLTFLNPSHLVQACIMGVIYLAIVSAAILASHRKFAGAEVANRSD